MGGFSAVISPSFSLLRRPTDLSVSLSLPPQLDVLEYIHENEYVHADVKASNLMLGYRDPSEVHMGSDVYSIGNWCLHHVNLL